MPDGESRGRIGTRARDPADGSPSRVEVRDLGQPEAVVSYPLGENQQVRLAGTVVSRIVLQPGWNWHDHAEPMVGTASCELYHRGVVLTFEARGPQELKGVEHEYELFAVAARETT